MGEDTKKKQTTDAKAHKDKTVYNSMTVMITIIVTLH